MYVTATAYCEGCTGIIATGIYLRDNLNFKIIASILILFLWVLKYGLKVMGLRLLEIQVGLLKEIK